MDANELDVVHLLHLLPMNEESGVFLSPGYPEVHNDLLGFAYAPQVGFRTVGEILE